MPKNQFKEIIKGKKIEISISFPKGKHYATAFNSIIRDIESKLTFINLTEKYNLELSQIYECSLDENNLYIRTVLKENFDKSLLSCENVRINTQEITTKKFKCSILILDQKNQEYKFENLSILKNEK